MSKIHIHAIAVAFTVLVGAASPVHARDDGKATAAENAASAAPPNWVRRGFPGAGHEALAPLVGTWRVTMGIYATMGRRETDPPITSDDIRARREWVGDGRYLEDTTQGTIEGSRYWRRGWLGYSNMYRDYEWVTIDALNSEMMSYASKRGSGPARTISLDGVFTDQRVAGEE